MGETIHQLNGIDICAELRGPDDGVPLLLVTGLGAQLTAEAVPHAVDVEIEGMGHNLPRALWPRILDEIDSTTRRTSVTS